MSLLRGKVSEQALEALEVFTRHNGWNEEDLQGWREFIVLTHLDGHYARRDELGQHLRETRPEDTDDETESLLDEYNESIKLLQVYDSLSSHAVLEN
ncbi:MAG: hypothetical protein QM831_22480 [Kofleriaceae bacterium]